MTDNGCNQLRDLRKVTKEPKKKIRRYGCPQNRRTVRPYFQRSQKAGRIERQHLQKDLQLSVQSSLALRISVKPGIFASFLTRDISKTVIGEGISR